MLSGLLRISNYLNARLQDTSAIREEYLDLRLESLPTYSPETICAYRKQLSSLLASVYDRFHFDVVAISCYSSFHYLSSVEAAFCVRTRVAPTCVVVVGGAHPSINPDDFAPHAVPEFFYDVYAGDVTPFNFVIREEAEIPFFRLITSLIERDSSDASRLFSILPPGCVEDLDSLPIIDASLYEKYQDQINTLGHFSLDFGRGCPFSCSFCAASCPSLPSYGNPRLKSTERCIAELKAIAEISWLSVDTICLLDPLFLPSRKPRREFLKALGKLKIESSFDYALHVFDRVDICTAADVAEYRRLGIIPEFGLESVSPSVLECVNKLGSNSARRTQMYIDKTRELIEVSNQYGALVFLDYVFGFPGAGPGEFEDFDRFFFDKTAGGQSLMERYDVNLHIGTYSAFPGARAYEDCERRFGGKVYYKEWWKHFDKNQRHLAKVVSPRADVSVGDVLRGASRSIEKVYQAQSAKGNPFYGEAYIRNFRKMTRAVESVTGTPFRA